MRLRFYFEDVAVMACDTDRLFFWDACGGGGFPYLALDEDVAYWVGFPDGDCFEGGALVADQGCRACEDFLPTGADG